VIPLGPAEDQLLVRVTREGIAEFRQEGLTVVKFVPLIGEQGWPVDGEHAHPS
jgi:protein-L-isoaspartate O-methyltransferase